MIWLPILPFDQGTTDVSFRTNAYPSIAVDGAGDIYVAWSERGFFSNNAAGGDARIEVLTVKPVYGSGSQIRSIRIAPPVTVDPYQGRGHQIMPAVGFSSGKLTVAWYDFRDDDQVAVYTAIGGGNYTSSEELPLGITPVFSNFIVDPSGPPYATNVWRHTVDVRAAQAPAGFPPAFRPSILVSQYSYGTPQITTAPPTELPQNPDDIQQLEFDAPNLPIFQLGTVPFVGDYIDVAGPTFIPSGTGNTEVWRFNNLPRDPDNTHVVWTDNRNVVQPADGNWAHYTPVGATGNTSSIFDPSETVPACVVGQTGNRNQDIFTATLSSGLIMGSKGNSKQLSNSLEREFPVTIQNPTSQTIYYQLDIQAQPPGGAASFLQYPVSGLPNPMTQITIGIPPNSSASRSVFITSSNPNASVPLYAVQTDVNNNVIPGGLSSTVTVNNDPSNPNDSNPNISNVEIYNPNISNPNISNPNISNPNISNPNISNPGVPNVAFANPNISNPNISNPNISNPNISNPNISNPNISNTAISGEITDVNYTITNSGNTSASYGVNLVGQGPPAGITVQLIISGVYLTPVANGCTLAVQAHYTPIANVPSATFLAPGSALPSGPPPLFAPTFTLQPGEQVILTLRVYDPFDSTPAAALARYNPVNSAIPVIGSLAINTNLPPPPPNQILTVLSIATSSLPSIALNGTYNVPLQATGGKLPYAWSIPASSLPPGITLQNGVLTGSPTAIGTYTIPIQVSDSSGQTAQRVLTLIVTPPALAITTTALPAGQFNAPYLFTFAASGGTPPYRWTLGEAVLPVGLSFDPTSGTLSGPPAQAGIWNVPVAVTDSTNSSQYVTLPLTIGLATGYAGAGNCWMPYPATPLHYPGAFTWTVNTSLLPNPAQMYILPHGGALAGCLTNGQGLNPIPTGIYPLSLTAYDSNSNPLQTLTFNLPVVASINEPLDNGLVNASPNEGELPPTALGPLQGVVTPGQAFQANLSYGADQGFTGAFLYGFSTDPLPQFENYTTTGPLNLTASAPGRYDIWLNGSYCGDNVPCSWPTSPAPLTIGSVDAINTTIQQGSFLTVSSVVVSLPSGSPYTIAQTLPAGNVLEVFDPANASAIPLNVSFNYTITDTACPDCIDQIEVGVASDFSGNLPIFQTCAYNGVDGPNGVSGTGNITVNVPDIPGRYYIAIDRGQDFSCRQSTSEWWNGLPSISRYIAVVDVWP